MRQLTIHESAFVSGAESHDVTIIDPIAAAQTFLFLMSVTDQDGFRYGSVITGMTGGAIGLGYFGYTSMVGAGILAGAAVGLAGAAAGAVVGGVAGKIAANFTISAYNWIMS